mgnify:CR=1 FL=1
MQMKDSVRIDYSEIGIKIQLVEARTYSGELSSSSHRVSVNLSDYFAILLRSVKLLIS